MENDSKMAGENKKHVIWVLLLSLLALITSFQQQLVVLYNLIFQLQQQQTMVMHLTHSAAVSRHFHLSRTRRSTRGLGERLWRKPGRTDVWWENLYTGRLPEDEWKKNFRMTRTVFMALADELRDYLEPSDACPRAGDVLTVEKQLAMTIYFLKDQGSLRMTANTFGVAVCTLSVVLRKVCACITRELGPRYISLPTTEEEMHQLRKSMEDKFGFPQAFACIDGTHIPIKQPTENAHDFFSYKMKYTINVQGVCDCRGVFIDVDVRWPGSLHDARVFSQSRISKMLREENLPMMYKRLLPGDDKVPVCLLGDPAYPLLPYCMKEYSSPRNNAEVIFNNMLRSARNTIERAYGRLKARWQILNRRLDIGLKDIPNIIYACFVLHNICDLNSMSVDAEDVERQIARDRAAQPETEPDRLYQFNAAEGVHIRNIITRVFAEHLPDTHH